MKLKMNQRPSLRGTSDASKIVFDPFVPKQSIKLCENSLPTNWIASPRKINLNLQDHEVARNDDTFYWTRSTWKNLRQASIFLFLIGSGLIITSCETIINPTLENAEPILVVDAWLNNNVQEQVIKISQTQPYFDNTGQVGVSSAVITVKNETDGRTFVFNEEGTTGNYKWIPSSPTDSIGKYQDQFTLSVQVGTDEFLASARLGRAPKIDSITFRFEEGNSFLPDHYIGSFWAKDFPGKGDTYWIKTYRNDTLLLKPSDINTAYDAGFSAGGNIDSVTFITPIREAISPFDTDDDGDILSPYDIGDSVYVEIHSISLQAFTFLAEVQVQTNRPGGFAELFSSPFANVSTNIVNTNPNGKKAVGFFNVGAIRGLGKRLVE
jgi:Domain of unknown function (DUF4249)